MAGWVDVSKWKPDAKFWQDYVAVLQSAHLVEVDLNAKVPQLAPGVPEIEPGEPEEGISDSGNPPLSVEQPLDEAADPDDSARAIEEVAAFEPDEVIVPDEPPIRGVYHPLDFGLEARPRPDFRRITER